MLHGILLQHNASNSRQDTILPQPQETVSTVYLKRIGLLGYTHILHIRSPYNTSDVFKKLKIHLVIVILKEKIQSTLSKQNHLDVFAILNFNRNCWEIIPFQ